MSRNEIEQAVMSENELAFSINNREYLLYGWDQCDGYVLNLEREGELIWQTTSPRKAECIDRFTEYYQSEL